MPLIVEHLAWPVSRLAELLEALARAGGLSPRTGAALGAAPLAASADSEALGAWIAAGAAALDIEAEGLQVTHAGVEDVLRSAGPAIVQLAADNGGPRFLALLEGGRQSVVLLGPDWRQHRLPLAKVAAWLREAREAPVAPEVDELLDRAAIPSARRPRARAALLRDRVGAASLGSGWLLRLPLHAPFAAHLRQARLPRYFVVFCATQVLYTLVWVASWWLVGQAAFEGRFDPGALLAWTFLLATLVPLSLLSSWAQGVFAVGTAALLKQRLLGGALRLDPDRTRHQGAGQHLARVFESEAIESLALGGGFSALMAALDLLTAVVIFVAAGQTVHVAGLVGVLLVTAIAARRMLSRRRLWTDLRLGMTHDLVERMIGHRTRLVQGAAGRRGEEAEEDETLERYLAQSRQLDRANLIVAATPRLWLLVAIAGIAPAFVGSRLSPELLAVTLGATLLAGGGLIKLVAGLMSLAGLRIAWWQIAPLLDAAARPESPGALEGSRWPTARGRHGELLTAHDIAFRFPGRAEPVLRRVGFRIAYGDRRLLTGASGSGKSTLVSLLTGLRAPDSGILLLEGLDRATLGSARWRRRIAAAVQFHENHVFTESLAFNLLMGRRWPPRGSDLALAEAICRRLGLGDLIDRMPGGLFQLVGETGWQLSHGERSRLFVARALLQGASLVVLDESFAELDPESLRACLHEVAEIAPTLVIVAHA